MTVHLPSSNKEPSVSQQRAIGQPTISQLPHVPIIHPLPAPLAAPFPRPEVWGINAGEALGGMGPGLELLLLLPLLVPLLLMLLLPLLSSLLLLMPATALPTPAPARPMPATVATTE